MLLMSMCFQIRNIKSMAFLKGLEKKAEGKDGVICSAEDGYYHRLFLDIDKRSRCRYIADY